jgi:DNA-binding MarR family transcriptional regulator
MQIKKIELTDEERKVLRTLARSGAMSPSKVSAETLILPGKTLNLLKNMADVGLVFLRDDPASADGRVVVLTAQARDLLALDAA